VVISAMPDSLLATEVLFIYVLAPRYDPVYSLTNDIPRRLTWDVSVL
jgi:hypothetical protein